MADSDSPNDITPLPSRSSGRKRPWQLQSSRFDQERHAHAARDVAGRRYARVLEIVAARACSADQLAGIADTVLAIDIPDGCRQSPAETGPAQHHFRAANSWSMMFGPMDRGPRCGGRDGLLPRLAIPVLQRRLLASELYERPRRAVGWLLDNTRGCWTTACWLPWLIRTTMTCFARRLPDRYRGGVQG